MAEGAGVRVRIARVCGECWNGTAPAWLGDDERRRFATLSVSGRSAFVASRRLLRDVLEEVTGRDADGWQVSAAAGVAPVASRRDGEPIGAPRVSLAHRLGWVAAAVGAAEGGAIGVDIECDRASRSDPADRAALLLAGDELARWHALDAARRTPALLHAWVAREAWFKAAGDGAPWDFRRLSCEPASAADANVRVWETHGLRVALCVHDAVARAQAACDGWPEGQYLTSTGWRVGVC